MSAPHAEHPKTATEYREQVAETLIAMLEKGVAPWQRPWSAAGGPQLPYNPVTGLTSDGGGRYRGGNFLYLHALQLINGYEDPRWVTFLQATRMKAGTLTPLTQAEIDHNKELPLSHADRVPTWRVKKGEHGTMIEKWGRWIPRKKQAHNPYSADALEADDETPSPRLYFKGFYVWNASQVDGVPPVERLELKWSPDERYARAQAIVDRLGVPIVTGHAAAYYNGMDRIEMPARERFDNGDAYYSTLLHECSHASGHKSRLNRPGITGAHPFGSEEYAKEELRVEIASMILAGDTGVPHDPTTTAAYVQSWLRSLRNDPSEIFRAAKDATTIGDYLLGYEYKIELRTDQPKIEEPRIPASAMSVGAL
jgi:antirestriction protein ArdC